MLPWSVGGDERLEGEDADSEDGEIGVDFEVFGPGFVFFEDGVAYPVVVGFAGFPMTADECCVCFGAVRAGWNIAEVKGLYGLAVFVSGAFALDDDEAARADEIRLGRFEGVDLYGSFIETSVAAFGFLGVDKKGVVAAF